MDSDKETITANDSLIQLVTFKIADEEFGVDISAVREINRTTRMTKLPNSPAFVDGIINLRGRVIPIIDMRKLLDMERRGHDKDTRIIVVEHDDKMVGIVVDAVKEVLRIPSSIVGAPPEIASRIGSNIIKSVGRLENRLLILIDIDEIFTTINIEEPCDQLSAVAAL
jgi:purine-binding chemotaxis protein CheW